MTATEGHTTIAERLSFWAALFVPASYSLWLKQYFQQYGWIETVLWAFTFFWLLGAASWHSYKRYEILRFRLKTQKDAEINLKLSFCVGEGYVQGIAVYRAKVENLNKTITAHGVQAYLVSVAANGIVLRDQVRRLAARDMFDPKDCDVYPVPFDQQFDIAFADSLVGLKWRIGFGPFNLSGVKSGHATDFLLQCGSITDEVHEDTRLTLVVRARADGVAPIEETVVLVVPHPLKPGTTKPYFADVILTLKPTAIR